jgi:phenylacetate-CoA ligase
MNPITGSIGDTYPRLEGLLQGQSALPRDRTWQQLAQGNAVKLFHQAARRVPAYRDFLRRRGINPDHVRTCEEYRRVPVTDKSNYIDCYPVEDLVWDGHLCRGGVITTSSGTTGAPYFWPWSSEEMDQAAAIHEFIYRSHFAVDRRKTLLVVCFGMGTWVAGFATSSASQLVSRKGYDLTIITPGFNKQESLKVLDELAPKWEQVIIAGIPSFVKDLLDAWDKKAQARRGTVKLLLAGEGFTESWRDRVLALTRGEQAWTDVVSILGSADAGLIGFETPQSVRIRRLAARQEGCQRLLFGRQRLPALLNYLPIHRFLEEENGELVVTACRALPLLRYNTRDRGGALTPAAMSERLRQAGFPAVEEPASEPGPRGGCALPFVYLFGRDALAATLYGANVYAENVQEVLLDRAVANRVTGRFALETKYTEDQDQFLEVNVELAQREPADDHLAIRLAELFVATVRRLSSEYDRICQEYGARAAPRVVLHPYGDPELFSEQVPKKSS